MKNRPYQGALETLHSRKGICSDFVHLFLAMTRAINIPSKAIIGLIMLEKGKWDVHSWAEVYDPNFGWTPIDITVQPIIIANLGINYIKRSSGFNCIDHLYAYFTDPETLNNPLSLEIHQQYIIDRSLVEIGIQS